MNLTNTSFNSIEERIREYAKRDSSYPLQAMLMYRMHVHIHQKIQDARNRILKEYNITETIFIALIIIDSKIEKMIQPSLLSEILGLSKTSATRIADELVKNKWVERYYTKEDRRCIFLKITPHGLEFLERIRPKQFENLVTICSALDENEQIIFEKLSRKILAKVESLENQE
ncbi:transcriptional repressor MprA [Thorsellia kenyensis]|uniref:Transcriptional repressor MprA n=1 Tax=Thorsellia kenyensis TaxID=1549888 RepID=A0ABV6CGX4_9GAMM